jgi:hypothetical protein
MLISSPNLFLLQLLLLLFHITTSMKPKLLFTLNIRVNGFMIPKQVRYTSTDTPHTAAGRFCLRITGKKDLSCMQTVFSAIHGRLRWANDDENYQPVHHSISLPVDFNHPPPRFDISSENDVFNGVSFLQNEGYAVFKNVADNEQVQKSINLFWKFMGKFDVIENFPSTYDNIPSNEFGIILQYGIGQSEFMWNIRTLPNVHKAFTAVWNNSDLITDFGGAVVLRPINNCTAGKWRTAESWYHVDQNGKSRSGLQTIQGSLILTNQTRKTGGLVVLPKSWKYHNQLSERASMHWNVSNDSHFLLVPKNDEIFNHYTRNNQPLFVSAEPGDLVLWDSRTVHCNTIGESITNASADQAWERKRKTDEVLTAEVTPRMDEEHVFLEREEQCNWGGGSKKLQRLVALVSMCPRSFATEDVLIQRRKAVHRQQTTTHWPQLFVADDPGEVLEKTLTEWQQKLIG